ncbi:MAG: tetratricopeptide repeat protein, partial [Gammaproteobacteria bacterium]
MSEVIIDENETLNQANQLYFSGKVNDALTLASELVEKELLLEKAYRLQSACYFQLQQYSYAQKSLIALLKINNSLAEDHFNLAHIYSLQKNYQLAEAEFEAGLKIEPKNSSAILNLTQVLIDQNKKEQAITLLNNIITRYPEMAEAKYKLALLKNDNEAVLLELKKMAKQKPLDVEAKLKLGNHYMDNADFDKATYYFNQAIAIGGNPLLAHFFAGIESYRIKQWPESIKHFKNALKHRLDEPFVYYELAKSYLIQGMFEQGWEALEWRRRVSPPAEYITSLLNDHLYWRGQSLKNKHILVYSEPTHGPTLLFSRYLADLKQETNKITFLVDETELPIIKKLNLVEDVISSKNKMPNNIDYIVSLLSIPDIKHLQYSNLTLHNIDKQQAVVLNQHNKIGICWHQSDKVLYATDNPIPLDTIIPIVKTIKSPLVCLHPEELTAIELEWCKENNIEIPSFN